MHPYIDVAAVQAIRISKSGRKTRPRKSLEHDNPRPKVLNHWMNTLATPSSELPRVEPLKQLQAFRVSV